MANILLVAPYQSFADLFRKVFDSHDEPVGPDCEPPEKHKLEILVEFEQENIYAMRPSCDILVARGFSAEILRSKDYVPVVVVPILPHDVIRCLKKSVTLYGKRRIVCPATHNMTAHLSALSDLLDINIEVIPMPSTTRLETEAAFARIDDPECVIIGGQPICRMAESLGYRHVMMESGSEAMRTAITETKRLAYVRRREQEKSQSVKTILDCNPDGIVALDRQNRFLSINATAEKMLGVSAAAAAGQEVRDFFSSAAFGEFLCAAPNYSDEVTSFRDIPLVVNKSGIFLENERIGSVITLQHVAKIQNSEKKIRNKIMERGLIARHTFANIYGKSPPFRKAIQTAYKYSQANASVLIAGGNGTGKELFAQSIHNASSRHRCPFVAINCAAIPDNLLESELFGYVEGAFTGASRGGKPGLIELAHDGTLFLDEIGEMPLRLQARLLRVLQEKEIMRLGSDKITHVDIRVISATNRDLFELAEAGKFREDLYYRLAVLTLRLPLLDERKEDIPGLAAMFLSAHRHGFALAPEAMDLLCGLSWSGNIRELRNACEQMAALSESDVIEADELRLILAEKINRRPQGKGKFEHDGQPNVSKEAVDELMARGHSKQKVADLLGINRTTLWRKLREWESLQL